MEEWRVISRGKGIRVVDCIMYRHSRTFLNDPQCAEKATSLGIFILIHYRYTYTGYRRMSLPTRSRNLSIRSGYYIHTRFVGTSFVLGCWLNLIVITYSRNRTLGHSIPIIAIV